MLTHPHWMHVDISNPFSVKSNNIIYKCSPQNIQDVQRGKASAATETLKLIGKCNYHLCNHNDKVSFGETAFYVQRL